MLLLKKSVKRNLFYAKRDLLRDCSSSSSSSRRCKPAGSAAGAAAVGAVAVGVAEVGAVEVVAENVAAAQKSVRKEAYHSSKETY